ncbi:MAG: hypothetical protein QOI40_1807, partial [Alphaproteobacteria bacterium]|nr:hypothetical protein [Alphaproteobacteria bacterium]
MVARRGPLDRDAFHDAVRPNCPGVD